MRRARARMVAATLLAGLSGAGFAGARPARAPRDLVAVMHVHTDLADGASGPVAIARAARAAGVDVLVLTDHYLARIAYAPWPIGNVLGVVISRPSIGPRDLPRYAATLASAEKAVPGILVIPGLELTPYARWSGSLLAGTLELHGWHRHLLVLGVSDPRALRHVPVTGNRSGGTYGAWSLLFAVPGAAMAWAIRGLLRPGYRETRVGNFRVRQRRPPVRHAAVGMAALGLLAAGFPYKVERFSPVGGDPGAAPFRAVVDYVHAIGGIALWAHPEASSQIDAPLGVRAVTGPYPDLVRLTGADGFAAFPEGSRRLLEAGGIWDRALADRGAVWAIAEMDEHRAAEAIDFRILQTVLSVNERTHAGVLEAIRGGRLYARWTPEGRPPLRLKEWRLQADTDSAGAGGSLEAPGRVAVRLAVEGGDGSAVTVRLVRSGAVIWSRRTVPPLEAIVEDDPPRPAFYRLDVEGAYPYRLISNPILLARRQEAP